MQPLNIVAIDDDPADLEILRRYLEAIPGRTVAFAGYVDPAGGRRALTQDGADVLFMDYVLGAENGLQVLGALRAEGIKTPIVILTGYGDEELAAALMKAGASDYLPKARMSPETLEQILRNALRIAELERQAAQAEEKLRLAAKVFDNVLEGVMVTDGEGTILSVNPAFSAITGYEVEEVVGQRPRILNSGLHNQGFFQALWDSLLTAGQWQGEIWNRRKSGNTYLAWQSISAVRGNDDRITHYVSVQFDITERKRHEETIRHQAQHDNLTGLPNRMLFNDRLSQALLHARREGEMVGVMFLDLDRFKEINDAMGHDIGDRLLQAVAERLKGHVRKGDTVARLGGDEFVLLLPSIKQLEHAMKLAAKIVASFAEAVIIDGRVLPVTTSLGISLFPKDGDQPEVLLKKADAAMYLAKQQGRNAYRLAE
jgi:diguanylate cyclase (GGDEF)-like protein/PAS domain S-box-containing protein